MLPRQQSLIAIDIGPRQYVGSRCGSISRLLKKIFQQPASPSVVSPGGRELEEGSQFYRRMPQAAANVQSFFSILPGARWMSDARSGTCLFGEQSRRFQRQKRHIWLVLWRGTGIAKWNEAGPTPVIET